MTHDPYANAGGHPDPHQAVSGYPVSGPSANYPQAAYSANPYEGAQQAPPMAPSPAQPQPSAGYSQSPGYPPETQFAPQPGQRGFAAPPQPSPFALLFDFGFKHVATPGLAKILPLGVLIACGLVWIGAVISAFQAASSYSGFTEYTGGSSVFAWLTAVAILLTGWLFPVIASGLTRIIVEMANASIDTAQAMKEGGRRAA